MALMTLMTPLLMGAYFNSCAKRTVGIWPNYAFLPANHAGAKAAATEAGNKGVFLFVHWGADWYNAAGCSAAAPCPFKDSDGDGIADVTEYLTAFLDEWVHKNKLSLNCNVVIQLHTQGFGVSKIGPTFLHGATETPASDANVRARFREFYAKVYDAMKSSNYANSADDKAFWIVSVGNEVDIYLGTNATKWSQFTTFANDMFSTTINGNPNQLRVMLSTTTTYFGAIHLNRDRAKTLYQSAWPMFTYYPIFNSPGHANHNHPVVPSIVAQDFAFMHQFLIELPGTRRVLLQEVGYATGNGCPVNPDGTMPNPSCNVETEQTTFVNNFFNTWSTYRNTVAAATWWSLYDYDPLNCAAQWGLGSPFCTMGLKNALGGNKSAWTAYKNGVAAAQSW